MTNEINDSEFEEFNDEIGEIEISDFEEKEYNLNSIGISNTYLCIEKDVTYIYSDEDLYIEIPTDLSIICKIDEINKQVIIQGEEDMQLQITEEQYRIILDILKN